MLKQDEHDSLRGSDQQSIIPYAHREDCCIIVYVLQASVELVWMDLVAPVVYLTFYSLRSSSYTVIQGPTGELRIVKSLYSS
jgi:hypothetical protein